MLQRRDQVSQLDQALRGQPVAQRGGGPVGPAHRQRHPSGRASLADQDELGPRTAALQEDSKPPGAPRLARTSSQALPRMSPRATLSNRAWKRRCGCCLALRYSTRCKARDLSRPSAFAVDLARMRALTDPLLEASRVDEAGVLP